MSGVILSGEEYVITVVLTSGFSYFYALFPEVSSLDTNDLHTFSHICHSSGSDYVQEVQSFFLSDFNFRKYLGCVIMLVFGLLLVFFDLFFTIFESFLDYGLGNFNR